MTGQRSQNCGEGTACTSLVIVPGEHADATTSADAAAFTLIHAPTGRPIAAADQPVALHHLAEHLAWFGDHAADPDYLRDPAHADVAASVAAVVAQWVSLAPTRATRSAVLAPASACQPPRE